MSAEAFSIPGARLVDPDSGYDGPGCVIVAEGVIADVVRAPVMAKGPVLMLGGSWSARSGAVRSGAVCLWGVRSWGVVQPGGEGG
jgi:hypothetical protein